MNHQRKIKVAVLGCGPAGLLAAHACEVKGAEYEIFSIPVKSKLYGSQYLHNPIPKLTEEGDAGTPVTYINLGTPEEYRRKTHGKWWDGIVAPEEFETNHVGWDIRWHYDELWRRYNHKINAYGIPDKKVADKWNTTIGFIVTNDLLLYDYDLIVSTVPRTLWTVEGDEFIYSEGWALGDAPDIGQFAEQIIDLGDSGFFTSGADGGMPDGHIVCDGTSDVSWTRASKVFGHMTVEWPHHAPKPHPSAVMVKKPLRFKPSEKRWNIANEAHWLHVGRYGAWKKGIVVTDAFDDVMARLEIVQLRLSGQDGEGNA